MAITTLTKHDLHQCRIHLTRGTGPHYAALRCQDCDKHIQWLNSHETHTLAGFGVEVWRSWNTQGLNGRAQFDF
jgi:hypothetical protein